MKTPMFNRRKNPATVKYIVIHTTATKPSIGTKELDKMRYHFVITRDGNFVCIRPVNTRSTKIHVALLGGLDNHGRHVDCRTERQNDALFNTLILLVERFDKAKIVGADTLSPYGFANPGFDIKAWLGSYIPKVLER
jgi:hypothetical protein